MEQDKKKEMEEQSPFHKTQQNETQEQDAPSTQGVQYMNSHILHRGQFQNSQQGFSEIDHPHQGSRGIDSSDNNLLSYQTTQNQFFDPNQNTSITRQTESDNNAICNLPSNELLAYFQSYIPHNLEMLNIEGIKKDLNLQLKRYKGSVYFGIYLNSKRHGQGVMIYSNGRIYEGEWENDTKHGKGYEIFPNGSHYQGQYVNGRPEGVGTYHYANGEVYDGQWVNGMKHGSGIWRGSQMDSYIGQWKFGKTDGYGVHTWVNGDRYEGQFKNCLKHGQGTEQFVNGDVYIGNYINGQPEGYGEYYWVNGSFFKGYFQNGLRHGHGIWRRGSGNSDSYEGEYVNDKKCGYGVFTWASGNIYKGNYFDDLRHGFGQMFWTDGSYYQGNWERGIQHGQGEMCMPGEIPKRGIFECNVFIGEVDNNNFNIINNSSNSTSATGTPHNKSVHYGNSMGTMMMMMSSHNNPAVQQNGGIGSNGIGNSEFHNSRSFGSGIGQPPLTGKSLHERGRSGGGIDVGASRTGHFDSNLNYSHSNRPNSHNVHSSNLNSSQMNSYNNNSFMSMNGAVNGAPAFGNGTLSSISHIPPPSTGGGNINQNSSFYNMNSQPHYYNNNAGNNYMNYGGGINQANHHPHHVHSAGVTQNMLPIINNFKPMSRDSTIGVGGGNYISQMHTTTHTSSKGNNHLYNSNNVSKQMLDFSQMTDNNGTTDNEGGRSSSSRPVTKSYLNRPQKSPNTSILSGRGLATGTTSSRNQNSFYSKQGGHSSGGCSRGCCGSRSTSANRRIVGESIDRPSLNNTLGKSAANQPWNRALSGGATQQSSLRSTASTNQPQGLNFTSNQPWNPGPAFKGRMSPTSEQPNDYLL